MPICTVFRSMTLFFYQMIVLKAQKEADGKKIINNGQAEEERDGLLYGAKNEQGGIV